MDGEHSGTAQYSGEFSFKSVPIYRALATICAIYISAIGIDWISSLCTEGMKAIFTFAMLCCIANFVWAIWYDAPYSVPPTWTFLKNEKYWSITIFSILVYQTTLVALSSFCCISIFIVTFANLEEVFDWECDFWI